MASKQVVIFVHYISTGGRFVQDPAGHLYWIKDGLPMTVRGGDMIVLEKHNDYSNTWELVEGEDG